MKKRLIWNFEIEGCQPLKLPDAAAPKSEEMKWEMRFFWPSDQPILLYGLDDSFLKLSQYKFKAREDQYLILNDRDYNIKIRNEQIAYKPKLDQTKRAFAYGRKRKYNSVDELPPPSGEPLDQSAFRNYIQNNAWVAQTSKEAAIYKYPISPKLTFELTRIRIANQTYFSLCIESKILSWVEWLSQSLVKDKTPQDYITFIKSTHNAYDD